MIQIKRSQSPRIFYSKEIERIKSSLEELHRSKFDKSQTSIRGIEEEYFDLEMQIVDHLKDEFRGACAFCGRKEEDYNTARLRPMEDAVGNDNIPSREHYFWLAYEWENLFLSCSACLSDTRNFFPVRKERGGIGSPINELTVNEEAEILDPSKFDPAVFFFYDLHGFFLTYELDSIYTSTISRFDLNRSALVRERMNLIDDFYAYVIEDFENDPEAVVMKWMQNQPYEGLRRQLICMHLLLKREEENEARKDQWNFVRDFMPEYEARFEDLKKAYSESGDVKMTPPEPVTTEEEGTGNFVSRSSILSAGMKKVTIENFKNIDFLEIDFESIRKNAQSSAPWFFLLGENGSGKSSILQSILLTLSGKLEIENLPINTEDFINYDSDFAEVRIESIEGETAILRLAGQSIQSNVSHFGSTEREKHMLAYGATRLSAGIEGMRFEEFDSPIRIQNFFDPLAGLVDAKDYLRSLTKADFDDLAIVLKDVLQLSESILKKADEGTIEVKENDIWFIKPGEPEKRLSTLSDGYKVLVALVCDIAKSVGSIHGGAVVFIDEIGTHLHPRWKMRIVSALRKGFPNIQFFVTSHEPLCLKGLKEGEVGIVSYEEGEVELTTDLPDPTKFRVDQLLTSPFFGLNSVVDPGEEELFAEYYGLLKRENQLDAEERKRLRELNRRVSEYNLMGNSLREELAYYAVDKLLSKRPKPNRKLKSDTVNMVRDLWDTYLKDLN